MQKSRFISIFLLPLGGLILFWKVLRMSTLSSELSLAGFFRGASDDLLLLGLFLLVLAFVLRLRLLPSASLLLSLFSSGVFSLIFGTLFCFEALAQLFFVRTGVMFDYSFFVQGLPRSQSLLPFVFHELQGEYLILLIFGFTYYLIVPQLCVLLLVRRSETRGQTRREANQESPSVFSTLLLSASLLAFSYLQRGPESRIDRTPIRNASLLFVQTLLEAKILSADAKENIAIRSPGKGAVISGKFEEYETRPRRNIVLILLESVRSASVSHYNPKQPTTPFFDDLARQSRVFERAYSVVPHTSKALVSALCGIIPTLSIEIRGAIPGRIPVHCLPDLLRPLGYRSAYFQSATEMFERRRSLVANFGFDEFFAGEQLPSEGMQFANYFGFEDSILLGPSETWLRANQGQPFFVTYMTNGPHSEYAPLRRFPRVDFVEDETENRYLNSIHALDAFLRELFEQYKRLGLYENTVFIISGDHGEGMKEHGIWGHGYLIYEEGVKVPMLIHDPLRRDKPESVKELVSILDFVPTVGDLLGFSLSGGKYEGVSLFQPRIARELFLHCLHPEHCGSTIHGFSKYIQGYQRHAEGLFDLRSDPGEKSNLAPDRTMETEIRRQKYFAKKSEINRNYELFHTLPLVSPNQGIERFLSPYRSLTELTPEHPTNVKLHSEIEFLGYSLNKKSAEPMDLMILELYFKVSGKLKRFSPDVALESPQISKGWHMRPLEGWDDPKDWPAEYYIIEPVALHVQVPDGAESVPIFWKLEAEFPEEGTTRLQTPWTILTTIPAAKR